ncbi:DNA damage-repair/toleration protein DRT100-like [Argentina anserina]|uniref:DNA damage-repair/toleration protein DRT100-like n=1 Tax=Argentina anserina TaxID=57926 RepID=UPI00217623BF|nr:DNA damage-repair/toleration protein DRT100-like [Potentilla anserina]
MKHHHLSSLLFFLFLTLRSLTPTSAACHVDDEAGLLAFKSAITSDPSNMLASWKKGTDCCTWSGVSCDNNRVTMLSLSGQPDKPTSYLSGKISPSLSKLTFLNGIYLQQLRNLTGSFPTFLFKLPNLKYVYIENSKLSGRIPASVGNLTQLEALSFYFNRFTGPIPSSISKLTQLGQLKLGGNLLTGSIPTGIKNLNKLTYLTLERNGLSGPIPDIFASFPELRILSLSSNEFTGKIPASISSLEPKLGFLELGHNALTGQIPAFLGNFKALDTLDLGHNKLTGTVPKALANLTKIFNLDLSHNQLVDPFPQLNVKGIESLDLSYNSFHLNDIPTWVTSSPIIYSLKLANCGIKLKLDNWKPAQTYYYDYIDLSGNQITGSPIGLLNKTDFLVGFWASGNKLKFNLESLRIVETFKHLDVSRNLVFGKVPKAVAGLDRLNVSYNHLCGQLPTTKFPASAFLGNDCLCGSPLAACKKA